MSSPYRTHVVVVLSMLAGCAAETPDGTRVLETQRTELSDSSLEIAVTTTEGQPGFGYVITLDSAEGQECAALDFADVRGSAAEAAIVDLLARSGALVDVTRSELAENLSMARGERREALVAMQNLLDAADMEAGGEATPEPPNVMFALNDVRFNSCMQHCGWGTERCAAYCSCRVYDGGGIITCTIASVGGLSPI